MTSTLTYPGTLLPAPFASNPAGGHYGGKNTIPSTSASPNASLADGFPDVTMIPEGSGGTPPAGKDFNGILNAITQLTTWITGGGKLKFDSTFCTAVGGYPVGVVLQLTDNVSEVVNVLANNTNDPNSVMTGWVPYGGAIAGSGLYQIDVGAVNAYVATQLPALSAYQNGSRIAFKAIHTNTGASTLNTGAGVHALVRSDGAAVVAGDIQSGSIYEAVYDLATTSFWLLRTLPSQSFSASHDVHGSRSYGVNYTNTTGKPMFVMAHGASNGVDGTILLRVNGSVVSNGYGPNTSSDATVGAMVAVGDYYSIQQYGAGVTMNVWTETY